MWRVNGWQIVREDTRFRTTRVVRPVGDLIEQHIWINMVTISIK